MSAITKMLALPFQQLEQTISGAWGKCTLPTFPILPIIEEISFSGDGVLARIRGKSRQWRMPLLEERERLGVELVLANLEDLIRHRCVYEIERVIKAALPVM